MEFEWIRRSFMLPSDAITEFDRKLRTSTSASGKFTDTTPGGNFAINNPPQFTRYADLKNKGRLSASKGMGRYYSEAIDDAAVNIHMRFGLPQFTSLNSFFMNFFDFSEATVANTGESPGFLFRIGQVAGFSIGLPFLPVSLLSTTYKYLTGEPSNKYYYSKPAMHLYWSAVNTIVNKIAVNMGFLGMAERESFSKDESGQAVGKNKSTLSGGDFKRFSEILPDVFKEDGLIDVFALSTRAQRIANAEMARISAALDSPMTQGKLISLGKQMEGPVTDPGGITYSQYMEKYHASELSKEVITEGKGADVRNNWKEEFMNAATADLQDGGNWVTFRVQTAKEVSESFSNEIGESAIAQKINSTASGGRDKRFSVSGGNLGDGEGLLGMMGSMVEGLIGMGKDLLTGTLDGLGMAGVSIMAGSANIDIPKHWKDSSVEMPKQSYKMELRTPYGNPLSVLLNLYIPLAMILAGTIPISTGRNSYTSPFLCELYSQGRCQTKLGMITSLNITRGTSNAGWSVSQKLPLGIDIDFTVSDMSSIMHMPLSNRWKLLDDETTAFDNYMNVLGSLTLNEQVYIGEKFKRNMSHVYARLKKYSSPHYWGSVAFKAGQSGDILSGLANFMERGK